MPAVSHSLGAFPEVGICPTALDIASADGNALAIVSGSKAQPGGRLATALNPGTRWAPTKEPSAGQLQRDPTKLPTPLQTLFVPNGDRA